MELCKKGNILTHLAL